MSLLVHVVIDFAHIAASDFQNIEFLEKGAILIQLWGKQKSPKEKKNISTKEFIKQRQEAAKGAVGKAQTHVSHFLMKEFILPRWKVC